MIDCLIIGPNELKVNKQARVYSMIGSENSIPNRILKQETIRVNKQVFSAPGIIANLEGKPKSEIFDSVSMPHILSPAIICLGSYLYDRGIIDFDYINLFLRQKDELKEKLINNKVLTVAITTTLYTTPEPIWEIISFIKKYNKEAKIIVGGPFIQGEVLSKNENDINKLFATLDADVYINSNQGEESLYQAVKAIKEEQPLKTVPNIFYKDGNNYIETYEQVEKSQLECPLENWKLFGERIGDFVFIKTAQSCPFTCAFCEFKQREGKYQNMEVALIEKQLDAVEKYTKAKSVVFIDDSFNIPKERFREILKMMIRNKYSFKWSSFFRGQDVDEETVKLLKESGCEFLKLGLESGNQQILDNMNKRTKVEGYYNAIELLNKYEIPHWTSFIVGFPGETHETFQDTVNLIETAKPMFYRVSPWYFSPFTPIEKQRDKYGLTGGRYEWKHNTMDTETAMNLCDEMVVNIKNSINLVLVEEDIMSLNHQGISIEEIKTFSKYFNEGIKEKILNSEQKEISRDIIEKLEYSVSHWGKADADKRQGE